MKTYDDDGCFVCMAKLEHIDVLKSKIKILQEIAAEERAVGNMYYNGIDFPDPSKDDLKEARDQLAGENPDVFDDPD